MDKNRQLLGMIVFLILWCAIHGNGDARVMVEMHTATGAITNISDKVITLEGGSLFYPLENSVSPPLNSGMIVTIRYYVESDGTYHYTKVALGENTLSGPGAGGEPGGDNILNNKHLK